MKKIVYPVVVREDAENNFIATFPDLQIVTVGSSVEDAYLMAQSYLQTYVDLTLKYENDLGSPSRYEDVVNKKVKQYALLCDASIEKPEPLSDKEKKYRDFVQKFFATED